MGERWKRKQTWILGGVLLMVVCTLVFFIFDWNIKGKQKADQKEPVTLTLVYAYQNAQWNQGIQTIVEAFQQRHGDIIIDTQVQYEDQVYEDALSKLQARGQLGDIVQLKTPVRYAREGLLVPIEESIGNMLEDTCIYEEEIYGVGAIGTTNGVLYNKDIFEQYQLTEPATYEEFLSICQLLKRQGITPVGVAGGDLWHMEFWVNHFFRTDIIAQNENWLTDRIAGKTSWQDEEALRMLTHLQQLFVSGYVNVDWPVKRDGNLAYCMSQGEVAMMYTGSWTARELQKFNPEMELGWFYLPDEEGTIIVSQNQDVFWSLTKECGDDQEKYEAALCFLEFFYDNDIYGALCEDTFGFPVTVEKVEYAENEIQLEIKEEFCTQHLHVSDYIGNEDTPEGFEKSLLYEIQDLAEQKTDIMTVAGRLDELWDYYQKQER